MFRINTSFSRGPDYRLSWSGSGLQSPSFNAGKYEMVRRHSHFHRLCRLWRGFLAVCITASLLAGAAYGKLNEKCAVSEARPQINAFVDPEEPVISQVKIPASPNIVPRVISGPTGESGKIRAPMDADSLKWLSTVSSFPTVSLSYDGRAIQFLGLRLVQNPTKSDCLATVVLFFAPDVLPNDKSGGQTFVFKGTSTLPPSAISRFGGDLEHVGSHTIPKRSLADEVVAFDEDQTFYVINLTELHDRLGTIRWKKRVSDYERVMADPRRTNSYKRINAQRFLLDIVRAYRYSPPRGGQDDFRSDVSQRLIAAHILCRDTAIAKTEDHSPTDQGMPKTVEIPCILKSSFFQTELGTLNPFAVSDALDNSGLAVGPRQIDLGQISDPATAVKSCLLNGEPPQRQAELSQFFVPIERLTPTGYRALYKEIIPLFNAKLSSGPAKEFVLNDFVEMITTPPSRNWRLNRIVIHDLSEHRAFEAVVIDFNNKWAGRTRLVSDRIGSHDYKSACEATVAWEAAFASINPPRGDIKDAYRRADIVLRAYYWETGQPRNQCGNLLVYE